MIRQFIAFGVLAIAVSPSFAQSGYAHTYAAARCGGSQEVDIEFGSVDLEFHGTCGDGHGGIASVNDATLNCWLSPGSFWGDLEIVADYYGTQADAASAFASADTYFHAGDLIFTDINDPDRGGTFEASMNYLVAAKIATAGQSNCDGRLPETRFHFLIGAPGSNATGDLHISGGSSTQSGDLADYLNDGEIVDRTTGHLGAIELKFPNTLDVYVYILGQDLYCDWGPPAERGVAASYGLLQLPCGGPVFNLPDGITLNSVQLGIVDNIWSGVAITQHPVDVTAKIGDASASFSVTVAGAGPPTYQWRKDGVELTDGDRISGATTSTLTITDIHAEDIGDYAVVVSGPCGDLSSSSASLSVSGKADVNCDGSVNFDDIDPFVLALINQSEYESRYPDCAYVNADINNDGSVDFNDIDGFVYCLINNGCP